MSMDGPGMGEIPPAILDDIMRTSHVVHASHFNGETTYNGVVICHHDVLGVGANETVPTSDQIKPQLIILEQPKSVSDIHTSWLY